METVAEHTATARNAIGKSYGHGPTPKIGSYASKALLDSVRIVTSLKRNDQVAVDAGIREAFEWVNTAAVEGDYETYFEEHLSDARLGTTGSRIVPLFATVQEEPHSAYGYFQRNWAQTKDLWAASGFDWSFWINLIEDLLAGRELDWGLLAEVALIDNAVWEQGPDAVAEAIANLDKSREPDLEPLTTNDEFLRSHHSALGQNARAIRLQLDTLRVFVEDEIERLRGANSLSSREREALTLRLEMLGKVVEAVTLMRAAFEEDAPGKNALVVVGAQLPAVVEAADNAVAGGGAPEVSAAIVSMATTIKYLTDAGTPGNYATGIAFADMCLGKIKSWWRRK